MHVRSDIFTRHMPGERCTGDVREVTEDKKRRKGKRWKMYCLTVLIMSTFDNWRSCITKQNQSIAELWAYSPPSMYLCRLTSSSRVLHSYLYESLPNITCNETTHHFHHDCVCISFSALPDVGLDL